MELAEPAPAVFCGKMTRRFAQRLVEECRTSTVEAVRCRWDVSWATVMRLVLVVAWLTARARHRRPVRVLQVDEKTMCRGRDQFSTIVSDGDSGAVLTVLEGRAGGVLAGWLRRQRPSWRRGVKVVVTDMSSAYRKGLHAGTAADDELWHDSMVLLPGAAHVVDRFHVVRNFLKFQVAMRRALQGAAGPGERRELQQARYLLLTRWDRVNGERRECLAALLAKYPALADAWGLAQRFHAIWGSIDEAAAWAQLDDFVTAYADANRRHPGVLNMHAEIASFLKWADEIFNYHRHGRATTNVAEGINNKIEVLERDGYGFVNRCNYAARIVLVCDGRSCAERAEHDRQRRCSADTAGARTA